MRERKKRRKGDDAPEDRRSPEAVRIIRADEAQAAIDAGQVAGRRGEDELRFGDVPPAPEGPRPSHRFPLPDTVDPAQAVPRRPVISAKRAADERRPARRALRIDPDQAHDPRPWDERVPEGRTDVEAPEGEEPDGTSLLPAGDEEGGEPEVAAGFPTAHGEPPAEIGDAPHPTAEEAGPEGAGWQPGGTEAVTGYDPQAFAQPPPQPEPGYHQPPGWDPEAYPAAGTPAWEPASSGEVHDPYGQGGYPAEPVGEVYGQGGYPAEPVGEVYGQGGYPAEPVGEVYGQGGHPAEPVGEVYGQGGYPPPQPGDPYAHPGQGATSPWEATAQPPAPTGPPGWEAGDAAAGTWTAPPQPPAYEPRAWTPQDQAAAYEPPSVPAEPAPGGQQPLESWQQFEERPAPGGTGWDPDHGLGATDDWAWPSDEAVAAADPAGGPARAPGSEQEAIGPPAAPPAVAPVGGMAEPAVVPPVPEAAEVPVPPLEPFLPDPEPALVAEHAEPFQPELDPEPEPGAESAEPVLAEPHPEPVAEPPETPQREPEPVAEHPEPAIAAELKAGLAAERAEPVAPVAERPEAEPVVEEPDAPAPTSSGAGGQGEERRLDEEATVAFAAATAAHDDVPDETTAVAVDDAAGPEKEPVGEVGGPGRAAEELHAGDEEGADAPWIEGAPMAGVHDEGEDREANPPSLGLSVRGSTELPHWTDPPSGEMAAIGGEDDLSAWRALGSNATRWRGDGDWDDDVDYDDLEDDGERIGALDTSRSEHSDLYSFDAAFEALEEERSGAHQALHVDGEEEEPEEDEEVERQPVVVGSGRSSGAGRPGGRNVRVPPVPGGGGGRPGGGPAPSGGGQRNLGQAVAVGIGLAAVILIAAAIAPWLTMLVSAVVVVACAVEGYGMMQRAGFRPATLLGLVATAGVMFAAYSKGEAALPIVAVVMFAATMLWYLLQIVEARPLANVAVTTMTWMWIGLLGSYAALMLRAHHGEGLFFGTLIPVVAADVVAFFVGRALGHRPLARAVSPGKTVEGVVAGAIAALVAGAIVGKEIAPWGGVKHGLLLGVVVAVLAPVGDLFESMIKRDLSLKDSGNILPGHGGLLDRFDAVLLVLPAAYYLASYVHVVKV
jgi:phosphatidate cytidylyltransferase